MKKMNSKDYLQKIKEENSDNKKLEAQIIGIEVPYDPKK